jgi:hypothetical protein
MNLEDFTPEQDALFRERCVQNYAATELAYIQRYLKGENKLYFKFHQDNLSLVKSCLAREEVQGETFK